MVALTSDDISTWRWKIGEVTDGLFIGGDLPAEETDAQRHLAQWVDQGVTHILDVREEWDDAELVATHAGHVGYTHLGTHDDGGEQDPAWFDAGVAAARAATEVDGTGLLIHCHMGINRGPSMAFAVLLDRGWAPSEALDAIRRARPIAAISYAEDAARWYSDRHGASSTTSSTVVSEVKGWHRRNGIDLSRVIRQIRLAEDG